MAEESTERVDELECKIAFLERQVEGLNNVVVSQQADIMKIMDYQKLMALKLQALEVREGGQFPTTETPPHY